MDIHSEAFDATFDRQPSAWQCDDGDNDFLNDRQLHPPAPLAENGFGRKRAAARPLIGLLVLPLSSY